MDFDFSEKPIFVTAASNKTLPRVLFDLELFSFVGVLGKTISRLAKKIIWLVNIDCSQK